MRRLALLSAGAVPSSLARQPRRSAFTDSAPTSGSSGTRQSRRVEDERLGLRAAEAAVERDQLLEGAALVEVGVVEGADHDVGDVREPVRAEQVPRRVRREVRERVLALDPSVVQEVRPLAPIASAPCSSERTSSQPTCGCAASAGTSRGWRCVDLLARHPARLVHQVDEPEVPRREHDDVLSGDVVLRPLFCLRAGSCRLAERRCRRRGRARRRRVERRDVRRTRASACTRSSRP